MRCWAFMPPPLPMVLNILRIWAYWRRRLLTSWTVVPEPRAMRLRRLPLMISWSRRSFGGHGVDDGFDAGELAFVDVVGGLLHAGEGADGGEHLEDGLHAAHLLDLTELVAEVFEGEAVAGEGLFGELLGLAAVELFFGALEEGGDVAHAHDAADDAVGVEGLEGVGLFAGAEELDGRAGDVADGEGGAAAGVAVHLGEDGAGDGEAVVEGLGGVDGVLAGHGVGDEEDFGGVEELFELRPSRP